MARIDWNIRTNARECLRCAKAFAEGDLCRSAVAPFDTDLVRELFAAKLAEEEAAVKAGETPKAHPEYVRLDFCDACWNDVPKAALISAWRRPYVAPVPVSEDPLAKASPESLLRSLLEGEEPENHLAVMYLLAVALERKRILVERAVRTAPNGRRVHIYEHRKSGDVLLLEDPNLTDEQIPEAQAEIERLLGIAPDGKTP